MGEISFPSENYKNPEEMSEVKMQDAKRRLLLFLSGKINPRNKIKTFSDPNTVYNLYSIKDFLKLTHIEIVNLLDSIPGFERINRYGTTVATAYKLKNPDLARSHLEKLLNYKS